MTQNQIAYQKHLEDVRTHKANEEIAARQAASSERQASVAESRLGYDALQAQASQTSAAAAMYGAQANAAYQTAMSAVSQFNAEENARHNLENELLSRLTLVNQKEIEKYKADKQADTAITTALISSSTQEETTTMKNKNATVNTLLSTAGDLASKLLTWRSR